MEIQATLQSIHLTSPQPQVLADFYCRVFGMSVKQLGTEFVCEGPGRSVIISNGTAKQLAYAHLRLNRHNDWLAFAALTKGQRSEPVPPRLSKLAEGEGRSFRDPDGNLIVFTASFETIAPPSKAPAPAASQHFALRTSRLEEMQAFYRERLGFVVSDEVRDPAGELRACFLRTDKLHHCLALFGAAISCFDHQSFETPSWNDIKHWGDHMASLQVPIVWGIGRHGPGNDVFFMVRDPDGNLAEISSEIEQCAPDRPTGQWPHEERTLNLWGKAIMRS
jgi:catechol-2,3-dioxygenase